MKRKDYSKRESKDNDFKVFMEYPVIKKKKDIEQNYVVPWQQVHEEKKIQH